MATEAEDLKNRGVYVHSVSRGFKRWFFSVSVPLEYFAWLPKLDERTIATVLDNLLQAAARTPGRRTQGAPGGR